MTEESLAMESSGPSPAAEWHFRRFASGGLWVALLGIGMFVQAEGRSILTPVMVATVLGAWAIQFSAAIGFFGLLGAQLQGLAVAATLRVRPKGRAMVVWIAATLVFNTLTSVLFFASFHSIGKIYANPLPALLSQ